MSSIMVSAAALVAATLAVGSVAQAQVPPFTPVTENVLRIPDPAD